MEHSAWSHMQGGVELFLYIIYSYNAGTFKWARRIMKAA